jgi:23S rRNA (cytosine1962-C5)-methyltransferase
MISVLQTHIEQFFGQPQPEARRLFHGRGRVYPGLEHICIDWFAPVVLISAYQPVQEIAALLAVLQQADQHQQVQCILLQHRYEKNSPAQCLYGEWPEQVLVEENGLTFEVHPGRRQNAGLFLDMRPLRQWLMQHCAGKNVLNLFAYTCSLSVAALAGSASGVTSVDLSKTSIAWGERNHLLNKQDMNRVKSIPYNLFTSWGRIKQFGRYDLVIIDPPTRQRGSFNAGKDYAAVLRKMPKLCNPEADIIAALNSPFLSENFLFEQFAANLPQSKLVGSMPVAEEFVDAEPGKGLKIVHYRLPLESASSA